MITTGTCTTAGQTIITVHIAPVGMYIGQVIIPGIAGTILIAEM